MKEVHPEKVRNAWRHYGLSEDIILTINILGKKGGAFGDRETRTRIYNQYRL